jgi:plastocyanin
MQVLAESAPKGFGLSLAVAVIAIFLAVGAISFAYLGSNTQISSLQSEVSSLQSAQGKIPTNLSLVNQTVSTRNIMVQWELLTPLQDRFFPDFIVVNQGDTVHLTFEVNDTGDAHTFTTTIPTNATGCSAGCEYQLNMSQAGLHNFVEAEALITGPATNCMVGGQPVSCAGMESGAIGNMTGHISFTLIAPGIYRYFCFYHQGIGMFGWIVVLPNARYHG